MPAAAVLGTGLIGASIGIGLRGGGWEVAGWDPNVAALRVAGEVGAVDRAHPTWRQAVAGADLVVLAGPASGVVELLGSLETSALVTDVAGVKTPVVGAGARLARFVGGHPMAGRETSGPEGASGSLFRGATWVLTSDHAAAADLEELGGIVSSLDAVPVVMTAAEHDEAVAAVSHLPQVVASALVDMAGRSPAGLRLAAGGFRDLTRIALSEAGWWSGVLAANGPFVAVGLRRLAAELEDWASLVEAGDDAGIGRRLEAARHLRAALAAPVAAIGVLLEDRPGEIARVGHALAASGVDLRDLQLRHATHGGGGVLTLSVRVPEVDGLRGALEDEGFRVTDGPV